jgi:hypothetical protein
VKRPSDPRAEIPGFGELVGPLIAFLRKVDWSSPDQVSRLVSRALADPSLMYAKFMATCVSFWLAPGAGRNAPVRPSADIERTFELLWLAYEQWYTRGFGHYAQVAAELDSFYMQLRWNVVNNRDNPQFIEDLDKFMVSAAHLYMSKVGELASENFDLYREELNGVLKDFDSLKNRPKDRYPGGGTTVAPSS